MYIQAVFNNFKKRIAKKMNFRFYRLQRLISITKINEQSTFLVSNLVIVKIKVPATLLSDYSNHLKPSTPRQ